MSVCSLEYDLLINGYENWWFPALGLLAGGAAALAYFSLGYAFRQPMNSNVKYTFVVAMVFCPAWAIAAFLWTRSDYTELAQRYSEGVFSEVSGKIENFDKLVPSGRTGDERFTVNGTDFYYSQYTASAGFRKTRSAGGPLRNDLFVRIRYIGNAIVRLEVCDA
jgi:hypothetical protein